MSYERYLGLDIGTKRIGVAVSDPLLITAQPHSVIPRIPENKSIEKIVELCNEYNVSKIIVGLPKNMDGTLGFQAEDVQNYVILMKESLDREIIFEDERLTSRQAERVLIEQNRKPSRNKSLIDMASAALILQQYLDRRR